MYPHKESLNLRLQKVRLLFSHINSEHEAVGKTAVFNLEKGVIHGINSYY